MLWTFGFLSSFVLWTLFHARLPKPVQVIEFVRIIAADMRVTREEFSGLIVVVGFGIRVGQVPHRGVGHAAERPDMLVADASVSDRPWGDIVGAFRKEREDIKVLVLCGRREAQAINRSGKKSVDGILTRPYSFDELLLRIRKLLGSKELDAFLRTVFRRVV